MPKSLSILLRICLFSANPQDLPSSPRLLFQTIVATLITLLIRNYYFLESGEALVITIVYVALMGIGLKLLLAIFKKQGRWLQSGAAFYGCSAVMIAVLLPVFMTAPPVIDGSNAFSLSGIFIMVAGLWNFAVIIRILKETLDISTALAILISIVMELTFFLIISQLFTGTGQ